MHREHCYRPEKTPWKKIVFRIIYLADTKMGKLFDLILLALIFISTFIVMMESTPMLDRRFHKWFIVLEAIISSFFTIEYALRIITTKDKKAYIFSFFGIIDLLSIVPYFLSLLFPITKYFMIIRMLRLLRVFRILNLLDFMNDGFLLVKSLKDSSRKIYIFSLFVVIFTIIVGSIMFMVEQRSPGFESIPQSVYWAVVTVTTVGYGDVAPSTPLGKFFSILLMLAGYSVIAVPTGIVTAEMNRQRKGCDQSCPRCGNHEIDKNARYCKMCGEKLVD